MEPRTGKMQVSLTPDDCERLDRAALGAGVTTSTLGARIIADNVRDAAESVRRRNRVTKPKGGTDHA